MFDKLIDIVLQFIDKITFWKIVDYYDRGVRLRFGNPQYEKDKDGKTIDEVIVLQPGLHFKWPFVDEILTIMIKTTTIPLREQTITTKDGKGIVVKAVLKYEINNAAKILIEANDPIDAIADMAQGIIRKTFIEINYDSCNDPKIEDQIKDKVKKEAVKWGIKILDVTLTDLGEMTSIRLLNSGTGYAKEEVALTHSTVSV